MSLADEWHDPSGPERDNRHPNAQDALDFIQAGFDAAEAVLLEAQAEELEATIEEEEALAYRGPDYPNL